MLLGATGTGKSATTAWLIERLQRPTLVMAPNKTLARPAGERASRDVAAQRRRVLRSTTTTTSPRRTSRRPTPTSRRTASINDDVERLRHSATSSLLSRRDVVVVASVSCIYGLGTPQAYMDRSVEVQVGRRCRVTRCCGAWSTSSTRATTWPSTGARSGSRRHGRDHPGVRGAGGPHRVLRRRGRSALLPASADRRGDQEGRLAADLSGHPLRGRPGADGAGDSDHRGRSWRAARRAGAPGQAVRGAAAADAHQLRRRDDARRSGSARESRTIRGTSTAGPAGSPGTRCSTTSPTDFLLVIDESHVTVPQIGGMYEGDMSRKRNLVDYGFRLPSAVDNRPLTLGGVRRPDRPDGVSCRRRRDPTSSASPAASSSSR